MFYTLVHKTIYTYLGLLEKIFTSQLKTMILSLSWGSRQKPDIQLFASRREYDIVFSTSEDAQEPSLRPWERELTLQWDFDKHSSLIYAYCSVCNTKVEFTVDLQWGGNYNRQNVPNPNWRERVNCSVCGLNQRLRSSILMVKNFAPKRTSRIWIAEQVTPVYRQLKNLYPNLVGSEYY